MNLKFKIIWFVLLGFSLGMGLLWQDSVYANNAYPGVTVSKENTNKKNRPLGYRGLIPGSSNDYKPVQQRKALIKYKKEKPKNKKQITKHTPKNRRVKTAVVRGGQSQPKKTMSNAYVKKRVETLEDVNLAALGASRGNFMSHVEKDVLSKISLPAAMIETLIEMPPESAKGLSMTERAAQIRIEKLFSYLDGANTKTPKKRKEIIRKIKNNLIAMERGYDMRKKIPRRIFLQIGLPEAYLDRQEDSLDSVLDMIKSAQKAIKNYR